LAFAISQLVKPRLTAMVALTAGMGYVLATGRLDAAIWRPLLGTFLLACGSAAWNQCQDAGLDARMARTRNRPIPSGRLDRGSAALVGAFLALLGGSVLASAQGQPMVCLALGGLAVVWYNLVYTLLKRVTTFAVMPGALLGAIGPMIGWSAGGGQLADPFILLVGAFFFVWQIPHFWLLMLRFGEDYAAAGLPSPTRIFAPPQLARITFTWISAAAAMAALLPTLTHGRIGPPWSYALLASSAWLALTAIRLLRPESMAEPEVLRRAFARINLFGLLAMLCLAASAVM
jgi:protoheme IX farnesyltransferase